MSRLKILAVLVAAVAVPSIAFADGSSATSGLSPSDLEHGQVPLLSQRNAFVKADAGQSASKANASEPSHPAAAAPKDSTGVGKQ